MTRNCRSLLTVTTTVAVIFFLVILANNDATGFKRDRRSPHGKKTKIVVIEGGSEFQGGGGSEFQSGSGSEFHRGGGSEFHSGGGSEFHSKGEYEFHTGGGSQFQSGSGWRAPAHPPPPPPIPPPKPDQTTIVENHHHHHTVVDHHHHHEVAAPPPPPPRKQASVYIEFNKQKEEENLKRFHAEMEAKRRQMEREKQEKLEKFKASAEAKIDILAQIPHQIASDIDLIAKKMQEDMERKKNENKGVSIQIWKNKGGGGHVNTGGGSSGSTEVHHHHHYITESQGPPPPPPPPPREVYRPPPPPRVVYRPPPKKTYQGSYEHEHSVQHQGDEFFKFLEDAGSKFTFPIWEESHSSSSGSAESGYGSKGKGFQLNIWKNKGRKR